MFEGKFEQGLENGTHTFYYNSGQIREVGNYKFGLKEGNWYSYNEEGLVLSEQTYKQGKLVRVDSEKVLQAENDNE